MKQMPRDKIKTKKLFGNIEKKFCKIVSIINIHLRR